MPCTKCEEGKYKWGETGECEYATKEDCESANSKYKMQPTPLGQKTYEEYAKELKEYNLSSVHRVELGLVDDIEKDSSQLKKEMSKALSLFDKALSEGVDALASYKIIKTNLSKLETQAKELGLKASDIPAYKKGIKALELFDKDRNLKRLLG